MAREKLLPPDESGNVPLWFMTYSDVITLLMTFFILLLTFATSEPENFEQMKVALFGANGGTGFASERDSPIESDALVERFRPDSSRITTQGSETPPSNPETLATPTGKGLSGLEEEPEHPLSRNYSVNLELAMLLDKSGNVTGTGAQQLRMLARQLNKGPHNLTLQVSSSADVTRAAELAAYMSDTLGVPPTRIAVGNRFDQNNDGLLRMRLELRHD